MCFYALNAREENSSAKGKLKDLPLSVASKRETERQRQTERETDRETDRERDTERERDRERERETLTLATPLS